MDHIINRSEYLSGDREIGSSSSLQTDKYDEEQVLFYLRSLSNLIDEDNKYMVVVGLMSLFSIRWADFKKWYDFHYTGK